MRGKERIGVFFFGEEVLNMIELKEKIKRVKAGFDVILGGAEAEVISREEVGGGGGNVEGGKGGGRR